MKAITVFYDARCGLCGTVKSWLEREPKYVKLFFVPYDSQHARELFPKISDWQPEREILVLTDEGGLYRGDGAWILCLWATVRYRPWSLRMAKPGLRFYAEKLCKLISRNRRTLSRVFRLGTDDDIRTEVVNIAKATPMGEACRVAIQHYEN
jgi:predicted DCC family thiol-disulfide oxidoreductase YuxK